MSQGAEAISGCLAVFALPFAPEICYSRPSCLHSLEHMGIIYVVRYHNLDQLSLPL